MSMDDFYNRINWENYPTEDTPLSDVNLNKMDYALKILSQRTATLDANKLELTPASGQGIVYYDYSASKIKTSQYLQFYPYPDGGSENFITFSSRELSDDQYQMPLHEMFIYPNLIEFNEYQSDGDSYAYYLDINLLKQILGLTFSESYVKDGYSLAKYFDIDYDTNKAEAGISLSAPLDYENPSDGNCHAIYSTKGISYYDDDQNVLTEIPLEDLANVVGTTSNIQTQLTALNSTLSGYGVHTLSDLGITTPCTVRQIVNALPSGCCVVISLSSGLVSDANYTGELYIRKASGNTVIHKTDLIIRTNASATTSLDGHYLIGMLPGTGNTVWYKPTLTAV